MCIFGILINKKDIKKYGDIRKRQIELFVSEFVRKEIVVSVFGVCYVFCIWGIYILMCRL